MSTFIFIDVSYAEDIFLEQEHLQIEIEKQIGDSDAAKLEAEETRKRLNKEKEAHRLAQEKFEAYRKKSKKEIKDMKREIAQNENKISSIKDQVDVLRDKTDNTRMQVKSTRDALDKASRLLVKEEGVRDQLLSEIEQLKSELSQLQQEKRTMNQRSLLAKRQVKKSKRIVNTTRAELSNILQSVKGQRDNYVLLLRSSRKKIRKNLKAIDQLDMATEIDLAYEKKTKATRGIASVSKLSLLHPAKKMQVSSKCLVKEHPSQGSRNLGEIRRGKYVRLSTHNSSWYTLVYKGEKVFVASSCVL